MQVEVNPKFTQDQDIFKKSTAIVAITPPLDENYWIARVVLHKDQAIVCFPKFFTIGCGFAQEEDWNTNLPLSQPARTIYEHIKHNKKYEDISDEDCIKAIELLKTALDRNSNG